MDMVVTPFTSNDGPALACVGGVFPLAWVGDSNILKIAFGTYAGGTGSFGSGNVNQWSGEMDVKVVGQDQPETSFNRPAMAVVGGELYIAWSGTDGAGTLSIGHWNSQGQAIDSKFIYWGQTSPHAPALLATPSGQLMLGWTGSDNDRTLSFAQSHSNPLDWPAQSQAVWGRHALDGPAMGYYPDVGTFVSWNSTDLTGSPYIQFSGLDINSNGLDYQFHVYNGNPAPGPDYSDHGPSMAIWRDHNTLDGSMILAYAGTDTHIYTQGVGGGIVAPPAFRDKCSDTTVHTPALCVGNFGGDTTFCAWTATNDAHNICFRDYASMAKLFTSQQ